MQLPTTRGAYIAYDNPNAEDEEEMTARVTMLANGGFHADCGNFDFEAADADAMRTKLKRCGYTVLAGAGRA
jgi:hypothetical protein